MIEVRRAVPADRERLFAFIAEAYGSQAPFKLPPRWDWAFGHPLHPEPGLLPMVVAVEPESGRVVGQSCFVALSLRIGGESRPMMWGADGFLLPDYRGRGLGYEMQRQLHALGRIFMSLNLSDANRRIKTHLGSVELPPVAVFVRRLRFGHRGVRRRLVHAAASRGVPARVGERVVGATRLDRLATAALNLRPSLRPRRTPVPVVDDDAPRRPSGPGASPLHLRVVERFDARFDRLWSELRDEVGAGVERDARYLTWKFARQPGMAYTCLAACRDDELAGYVVFRAGRPPEANRGLIADLLARPTDGEAMRAMLEAAVERLDARGVEDIEAASTVPAYQEALRDVGFRAVGESVPMFFAGERTEELVGRAGGWLLGRADSDWDQYPSLWP